MLILLFLLFSVCHGTSVLDTQVKNLHSKVCPYVDFDGISHNCKKGDGDVQKTELLTVNALTGQGAYPVIDLDKSAGVQNRTGLQQTCHPLVFKNIQEFYSKFYDLNAIAGQGSWEYFNGMFREDSVTQDIIPMLNTMTSSAMRQQLTTNQLLYSFETVSVDQKNAVVNNEFQTIVDKYLPTDYNADQYGKFVNTFGTHVALSCDYGGMLQLDEFIQECNKDIYFLKTLDNDLCADIKAFITNPETPPRGGSADYQKSTSVKRTRIVGGDPTLTEKKEWVTRIGSFEADPVGIRCTMVPIANFITDSAKKANVQKYILDYVSQESAARAKLFSDAIKKTPIPFVFSTVAPGDGYEYAQALPGNLAAGEKKVWKMDWSYHTRRDGKPHIVIRNVTEYDETIYYPKPGDDEDRTIKICENNVQKYFNDTGGPGNDKEIGNGQYLITCECKEDRSCGCWISDVILTPGGPAKCPDWNNLCYNTFDPPVVLNEKTVKFSKSGNTAVGCIPKYWTVYYYYVNHADYTKLWGGWSVVDAHVNCEKLVYQNNVVSCQCQLG